MSISSKLWKEWCKFHVSVGALLETLRATCATSVLPRDLSYTGNVLIELIERHIPGFFWPCICLPLLKKRWFNIILSICSILFILFHQDNMIKVVKTSLLSTWFPSFWLCFIIWLVVSTHLKNMLVKMGSSSPNRGENKKYVKPPPSHCLLCILWVGIGRISPMSCHRVRGTLLG